MTVELLALTGTIREAAYAYQKAAREFGEIHKPWVASLSPSEYRKHFLPGGRAELPEHVAAAARKSNAAKAALVQAAIEAFPLESAQ